MSDERIRELERRYKESHSPEDGEAWMRAVIQGTRDFDTFALVKHVVRVEDALRMFLHDVEATGDTMVAALDANDVLRREPTPYAVVEWMRKQSELVTPPEPERNPFPDDLHEACQHANAFILHIDLETTLPDGYEAPDPVQVPVYCSARGRLSGKQVLYQVAMARWIQTPEDNREDRSPCPEDTIRLWCITDDSRHGTSFMDYLGTAGAPVPVPKILLDAGVIESVNLHVTPLFDHPGSRSYIIGPGRH